MKIMISIIKYLCCFTQVSEDPWKPYRNWDQTTEKKTCTCTVPWDF